MPDENTPHNSSLGSNRKKKKFLVVVVASVTILVLVISTAFLYFTLVGGYSSETESTEIEENSEITRVIGESAGKLPYAPIDEKNTVSLSLDKSGGVLTTTLSKNVKAFLVVPEGEIIQDAIISLVPYKAMPSQKNHGGLSGEYGFGLQVSVKSIQTGVGGYLVFDVKGGKATEEAATRGGYKNRCDPRFKWFNPLICARTNEVPARQVVIKNSTIITPIHTEKYNSLVFTNNTIPLGIDGLIVTRIDKGDVYIPQKLDKDLASSLVEKTIGKYGNDSERLEAAALAKEWNIDLNTDQLEVLADSKGVTYQELVKSYHLFRGYREQAKDDLVNIKNKVTDNEDEKDKKDEESKDYEYIISILRKSEESVSKILVEDAKFDTKKFDGDISVEAAAALGAASDLGLTSATEAASSAETSLERQFNQETNIGDALGELEAAQVTGRGEAIASESVKNSATNLINDTINNPNSSIPNLLDAAALDQALGLDDLADKALEKIKEKLENSLKEDLSKEEVLEFSVLAQMLGFDDIASQFIKIAETAKKKDCDLIKKNLSNFGVNECK